MKTSAALRPCVVIQRFVEQALDRVSGECHRVIVMITIMLAASD